MVRIATSGWHVNIARGALKHPTVQAELLFALAQENAGEVN